jgi:hypothetical protein
LTISITRINGINCRGQIDDADAMTSSGKNYSPLTLLGKLEIASRDDSVCYGNMTLLYTPSGEIQDKMAVDIKRYIQLYCQQKEKFPANSDVSDNLLLTAVENEEQIVEKYKEFKSAEEAGGETHRRVLGGVVFKDITKDKLDYQLRYGQDFRKVLHLQNIV